MINSKDFNYSYWELKAYFKRFDLIVVGSGIVGLSTAISFRTKNPKASILILEQGLLPDGASTKNAGFACFGSAGELLSDLESTDETIVWQTVEMRWKGLQLLRKRLGDHNLGYVAHGGFELFFTGAGYEKCSESLQKLNAQVKAVLGISGCYESMKEGDISFRSCRGAIKNRYEGQLDTGCLMTSLLSLAAHSQIQVLNNVNVSQLDDAGNEVKILTSAGVFRASRVVVATNGFAAGLLGIKNVLPARAQVLVTKPITGLKIKGTYHFEEGYYYFRDIDDRILFGGGRNLDIGGETTIEKKINPVIHAQLDRYLRERILPDIPFEVEARWSGIMGVGPEKKPIIQNFTNNIIVAVRMGGMGIAIGSLVGQEAATLAG